MRTSVTRLCMAAAAVVMISTVVEAHVSISPSQSTQGAT